MDIEQKITKKLIVSPKRVRNNFFSLKIAEDDIYQSLLYHFHRYYPAGDTVFDKYKERILTISLFLFTTSSFLYRRKTSNNLYSFHWRNYIQIFSRGDLLDFIDCSILYMIEYDHFSENDKQLIRKHFPESIPSFQKAYYLSLFKRNSVDRRFNLIGLPFEKYLSLIRLSLRLFELIRYEIAKNYSKVIELIELTDIWKEKMVEIFNYKSEYIAFLYFVNLRRRKNRLLQNAWVKLLCSISILFG